MAGESPSSPPPVLLSLRGLTTVVAVMAFRPANLMKRVWLLCLLALLGVVGVGCSSFRRDWNVAIKAPSASNSLSSIEGPWEGRWHSDDSGHSGRLRCLLQSTGSTGHEARFHATYLRWLTFGYTVPIEVSRAPGQSTFQGSANLGSLAGGVYTYEGRIVGTNFSSTYRSSADHGTFELTRPLPGSERR